MDVPAHKRPAPRTVAAHLAAVGTRIRTARHRRNLAIHEAADLAGMTAFTWRRVEAGYPGVSWSSVVKVLVVLNLEDGLAQVGDDPGASDGPAFRRSLRERAIPMRRSTRRKVQAAGSPTPDTTAHHG
jgi:hypothetical protein